MTDIKRGAHGGRNLVHQPTGGINQVNPVSATLYTVLAQTGRPFRLIHLYASVVWTAQPNPLEVILTVDGVAMTFTQANPVTATPYYPMVRGNLLDANQLFTVTDVSIANPLGFMLEGSDLLIQARTTGGTVQNLIVVLRYALK